MINNNFISEYLRSRYFDNKSKDSKKIRNFFLLNISLINNFFEEKFNKKFVINFVDDHFVDNHYDEYVNNYTKEIHKNLFYCLRLYIISKKLEYFFYSEELHNLIFYLLDFFYINNKCIFNLVKSNIHNILFYEYICLYIQKISYNEDEKILNKSLRLNFNKHLFITNELNEYTYSNKCSYLNFIHALLRMNIYFNLDKLNKDDTISSIKISREEYDNVMKEVSKKNFCLEDPD
jgi:hypothetical protein